MITVSIIPMRDSEPRPALINPAYIVLVEDTPDAASYGPDDLTVLEMHNGTRLHVAEALSQVNNRIDQDREGRVTISPDEIVDTVRRPQRVSTGLRADR